MLTDKGESMNSEKHDLLDTHMLRHYEKELEEISSLLHEDIAQKMYALFNHLQYVQQYIDDRQDRTRNEEMIKLTKCTIEDLRFISQDVLPFCHKGINGAIEAFLMNYSKKNGVSVQIHSYGEKKRLPQIVEVFSYRILKDMLNNLADLFTVSHLEVTCFWEEIVQIRINYTIELQSKNQHEQFLNHILEYKEKMELVKGTINLERIDEHHSQLTLSIQNER